MTVSRDSVDFCWTGRCGALEEITALEDITRRGVRAGNRMADLAERAQDQAQTYQRAWAALGALIREQPHCSGEDVLALMPRVLKQSAEFVKQRKGAQVVA